MPPLPLQPETFALETLARIHQLRGDHAEAAALVERAASITPTARYLWSAGLNRYALDFYPFLFLLTARGIGEQVGWHQKGFILAGVIVNLWAVLWIYQFGPHQTFGWEWKYLL